MAENDTFFKHISGGIEAAQSMQLRAVNLERQDAELQEKKRDIKNGMFQQFLTKTQNVIMQPKGPMRDIHKKHLDGWIQETGYQVTPDYTKMLDDDGFRVNMGKLAGELLGINDPDKLAEVVDVSTPFMLDGSKFGLAVGQQVATLEQQRAELAAHKAAERNKEDPQKKMDVDTLKDWETDKTTVSTAAMKSAYNKMLSAAGSKANQDPDLVREITAQFGSESVKGKGYDDLALIYGYLKMLDPNTGVKEGEVSFLGEASPLTDELVKKLKRVVTSGSTVNLLTPEAKNQIIAAAKSTMAAQQATQAPVNARFAKRIEAFGGDVARFKKAAGLDESVGENARTALRRSLYDKYVKAGNTPEQAQQLVQQAEESAKQKRMQVKRTPNGPAK